MLDVSIYKRKELPYKSKSVFKWMWFFIKPFKKRFFLLTFNRIVSAWLFLTVPFFVSFLINFVSSPEFELDKNKAYTYLFWIFIVFSIWNILAFYRKYETFFRDELKRKLTIFSTMHNLDLSLSWHENQWTWNKMQRILKAREAFRSLVNMFFANILQQTWRLLMIISVLAFTAPWYISLTFILYAFFFFLLIYFKSGKIWHLTDIVNLYYEKVVWKWYEFASSIFVVKFFNLKKFIEIKSKIVENEHMWKVINLINAIYKKWVYFNF